MRYRNLTFLFTLIVLLQCTNPFTTRDPEKPDSGSQVYENPSQPKIVLDNMIMAIKEKNINEYIKVFVPVDYKYLFRFEPEPSLPNENLFIGWSIQDERTYFDNLVSKTTGLYPKLKLSYNVTEYSFTSVISGSEEDSVRTNNMQYVLTVDTGDSTAIYTGNTEFKLFRSQSDQFWYIYYWQDNAIDENYSQTWTNLKIQNYLGK